MDDAVEADNGGKNKVHSPSTASSVDPNSLKGTDDNDSVHSQDDHGLPTQQSKIFESKQGSLRLTSGPGIERNDEDLIELLKVKPKGFQSCERMMGSKNFSAECQKSE